jgi:hypothetical protein
MHGQSRLQGFGSEVCAKVSEAAGEGGEAPYHDLSFAGHSLKHLHGNAAVFFPNTLRTRDALDCTQNGLPQVFFFLSDLYQSTGTLARV